MVLMVVAALNFARHFIALKRLSLRALQGGPRGQAIFALLALSVLGHRDAARWHGVYPDFLQRCATPPSTSSRRRPPAGSPPRTTRAGRCSRPTGCCSCPASSAAPARPAAASRCSARCCSRARRARAEAADPPGGRWRRCASAAAWSRIAVGHAVLAFIFLYFVTVVVLTFAMLLTGLDFDSSFSAVVASINNTAHGFGAPGARAQLPCPEHRADLDLHRGDARRAAGDLQHRGADAPGVLAQVARSAFSARRAGRPPR